MATLFRGGRLFHGTGAEARDADILVHGSVIAKVGGNLLAADANVEELARCTVLPGIIDRHTHITNGNAVREANAWQDADTLPTEREAGFLVGLDGGVQDALAGTRFAERTLAASFTTFYDVGSSRRYSDIALREAVARGFVADPQILAYGSGIAMTEGHSWWMVFVEADGVDKERQVTQ